MNIWSKFIQPLFSQSCLLCGAAGDTGEAICSDCQLELPWLGAQCRLCALPLPLDDLLCGDCLQRLPLFQRVEAPWRYHFPVDALINRFKHGQQRPVGRLLAALLSEHLRHAYDEGLARPDLLLPVPLAPARQRQRGFNQAGLLGSWLAGSLQLDCDQRLLQRRIDTPTQQGLSARQRKRNLRHAFVLREPATVAGRHLALVDDVLTTGSTANAITRLLLQAGATRVDVYCLARTPKPGGISQTVHPAPDPAG